MKFLNKSSSESRTAFVGTFVVHIILFLIALLYFLPEQAKSVVTVVQLGCGNVSNFGQPSSTKQKKIASASAQKIIHKHKKTRLPKVKLPIADNKKHGKPTVIQQSSKKNQTNSTLRNVDDVTSRSSVSTMNNSGANEQTNDGKENASGNGSDNSILSGEGSVGFSISWKGGGTRKLLEGNLPPYPPGVNERAQIKIQTTVLPDGSVEKCTPIKTAHRLLVEAALREIRLWRFDPLDASYPQAKDRKSVV